MSYSPRIVQGPSVILMRNKVLLVWAESLDLIQRGQEGQRDIPPTGCTLNSRLWKLFSLKWLLFQINEPEKCSPATRKLLQIRMLSLTSAVILQRWTWTEGLLLCSDPFILWEMSQSPPKPPPLSAAYLPFSSLQALLFVIFLSTRHHDPRLLAVWRVLESTHACGSSLVYHQL